MSTLIRDIKKSNKNQYRRAASIFRAVYADRDFTEAERSGLIREIVERFLDSDNHKRAFNLRIARRFDAEELDTYYDKARGGYRKFYDTTVYAGGNSFYLGFNYG